MQFCARAIFTAISSGIFSFRWIWRSEQITNVQARKHAVSTLVTIPLVHIHRKEKIALQIAANCKCKRYFKTGDRWFLTFTMHSSKIMRALTFIISVIQSQTLAAIFTWAITARGMHSICDRGRRSLTNAAFSRTSTISQHTTPWTTTIQYFWCHETHHHNVSPSNALDNDKHICRSRQHKSLRSCKDRGHRVVFFLENHFEMSSPIAVLAGQLIAGIGKEERWKERHVLSKYTW
jgi:hypothetical protein